MNTNTKTSDTSLNLTDENVELQKLQDSVLHEFLYTLDEFDFVKTNVIQIEKAFPLCVGQDIIKIVSYLQDLSMAYASVDDEVKGKDVSFKWSMWYSSPNNVGGWLPASEVCLRVSEYNAGLTRGVLSIPTVKKYLSKLLGVNLPIQLGLTLGAYAPILGVLAPQLKRSSNMSFRIKDLEREKLTITMLSVDGEFVSPGRQFELVLPNNYATFTA